MKKYFLFSLLAISVLTLSACGSSTENKTNETVLDEEEGTVLNTETTAAGGQNTNMNIDKNKLKQELSGIAGAEEIAVSTSTGTVKKTTMMNLDNNKFENLTAQYTQATFNTNQGNFTIKFYNEKAPLTVNNFLNLAKVGYYNNVKFHRVIANFMIQGGDQYTKEDSLISRWGTGGPGYTINDEFGEGLSNKIGTISMANAGANTGGSQFFINVADNSYLDGKHAVFGEVVEGMDIVNKISQTSVDASDRPTSPVIINSITLK